LFVHVTTVPLFTVSEDGSNAKFLMLIVFPPVVVVVDAAVDGGACGEEHPAAMQETTKRTTHARQKIKRDFACITPYWIVR
jgi:hypothetical protein